jgi:hypothetical protein
VTKLGDATRIAFEDDYHSATDLRSRNCHGSIAEK